MKSWDELITPEISIHALREESDCLWLRPVRLAIYFNPRSP